MNKENCALKLVNEIILYYDARSKKHQNSPSMLQLVVYNVTSGLYTVKPWTTDKGNIFKYVT